MTTIPVILAADNNYAPYMSVLMISILKNAKSNTFLDFYLLVPDNFKEEYKNKIEKDCNFYKNKQINFVNMKKAFSETKRMISHITEQTYYRLRAAEILPDKYDKCIYLDIDTVVNCDLSDLYNVDLDDNYVAGVKAPGYHYDIFPEAWNKNYSEKIGIPSINQYINAGVIVLNLQKIRKDNLTPVLYEEALKSYPTQDQDVINKVFYNKIKHLPFYFNAMVTRIFADDKKLEKLFTKGEFDKTRTNPCIIHYSTQLKPWQDKNCIFSNYWWKYASLSCFHYSILYSLMKKNLNLCMTNFKDGLYTVTQEKTHRVIKILGIKIKIRSPQIETPEPVDYLSQTNDTPITIERCPLCESKQYIIAKDYSIQSLIERWTKQYSFVPFADCYKDKILERRICTNCGMNFYNYTIPDTAEFYEKLGKLHNLYAKNKWDYDEAVKIVKKYKPQSLMDIGCGYGYFLEKIKNAVPNIAGSEFNPAAINVCKSKNIKLYTTNLREVPEKFDLITAFQVLEHVKDTKDFIENCLNLLNDNGHLLFVTPNPDGELIKYNPGILELPPHHCCDISKEAYEFIAKTYNLEIIDYKEQEIELGIYRAYIKGKHCLELSNKDLYEKYLLEKDQLIGKGHLVLFRKRNDIN